MTVECPVISIETFTTSLTPVTWYLNLFDAIAPYDIITLQRVNRIRSTHRTMWFVSQTTTLTQFIVWFTWKRLDWYVWLFVSGARLCLHMIQFVARLH